MLITLKSSGGTKVCRGKQDNNAVINIGGMSALAFPLCVAHYGGQLCLSLGCVPSLLVDKIIKPRLASIYFAVEH